MKQLTLIASILLGAIFVIFGLNFWFKFIPIPKSEGMPAEFMGVLFKSGFLQIIKSIEVIGGVLLLTRRYAPLGLVLLTPVIANIIGYDLFIAKGFNPLGLAVAVLGAFLLIAFKKNYAGIFAAPKK